jgi:hypothetical protein
MKNFIALLFVSLLAACGGGGGGGGTDTSGSAINFTLGNETVRIDKTTEYTVDIPSAGNVVTIGAGNTVTHVIVTGVNNSLIVENSALIRAMEITGANTSVSLGTTVTVPRLDIFGANASLTVRAGDRIDRLAISGSNAIVNILDLSAMVPVIIMSGSNITLRVPTGFLPSTTITNTGANNIVTQQ